MLSFLTPFCFFLSQDSLLSMANTGHLGPRSLTLPSLTVFYPLTVVQYYSHRWLFKHKLEFKMQLSKVAPATFSVLSSHAWPVAAVLDRAARDLNTHASLQRLPLCDCPGRPPCTCANRQVLGHQRSSPGVSTTHSCITSKQLLQCGCISFFSFLCLLTNDWLSRSELINTHWIN